MKITHKLGMSYMGSKRKIAKPLIDFMLKENPNAKYFYDIFGGGGAMSFEAMQRPQIKQTFYNEFNTGVVELLKDIRDFGVTDKYYQWIDRETFNKHKDDSTWFGGMISTCWSFGNNKDKGYLFNKGIEDDKKLLHLVVVDKCEKSLETFNTKFELDIKMTAGLFDESMNQRRLRIEKDLAKALTRENIKKIGKIVDIQKGKEVYSLLESLIRMQQVERLNKLQQLQQLQISNLSYELVNIATPTNETIIYLDPPYKDKAKYAKGICHKEFYIWVDELTARGYKVYVSSYESHLPCVLELKHTCSLSATSTNEVTEKLFTNKESEIKKDAVEVRATQASLF